MDTMIKSKWEAPKIDKKAVDAFAESMRLASDRKQVAITLDVTMDELANRWKGEIPAPRFHLFFYDREAGVLTPYHKGYDVEKWRTLVDSYCTWFKLTRLEQFASFWEDIVECLLSNPKFEAEASDAFRAWAYGCMAKFHLNMKKKKGSHQREAVSTPPDAYIPQ